MDCCYFTIRLVFLFLMLLVALSHSTSSSAYTVAGRVENKNDTKGLNTELLCSGETRRAMRMKGRKMSTGKCEHGGKKKGEADQGRFRSSDGDSISRVKLFSYAPFTSDYGRPKTHPPKNN